MWPSYHWPSYHWPERHWPLVPNHVEQVARSLRTRRLLDERWHVVLVDATGVRRGLGWMDVPTTAAGTITVPAWIPDGLYDVEIETYGMAWSGLIQKNIGSILIDSGASERAEEGLPLLTNLRYDWNEGYIRLRWDGEVAPEDSGLVSTGIWLDNGVPNFGTDPTYTIPLFSNFTTHQYILFENQTYTHAGVAAIRDSDTGDGAWILLPTLAEDDAGAVTVVNPSTVIVEG